MGEAEWIIRAQSGDHDAFRWLVEENQSKVYHLLLGMLRDEHLAQELTQMTFVKAWKSLGSFRHRAGFWTWLYRIAYHLAMDHHRASRFETVALESQDGLMDGQADPLETALSRDRSRMLLAALQQLPIHQRTAVVLFYFQGMTYEAIAEITGRKLDTIRSDLFRGKARLKQIIQNERGWNGELG